MQAALRAVRAMNYRFHSHFYSLAKQPQTLHFMQVLWAKYPFDLINLIAGRVSAGCVDAAAMHAARRRRNLRIMRSKNLSAYFPAGTTAITSISTIMPGRASWLMTRKVCTGSGPPLNTSALHLFMASRSLMSTT